MSTNSEFRCDEEIVKMVEDANLPLSALRVLYGLHYLIDSDPMKNVTMMGVPHRRSMQVKGRRIIQSTFPSTTNDLRLLRTARESLLDSKIMAKYDYNPEQSTLSFRYSDKAIEASEQRKNGKFAIVDSAWFTRLSTPAQIMFYIRVKMHECMKAPTFPIPGISSSRPWQKIRRPWFAAAEKLSAELGQDYLFCPEINNMSEQARAVWVKISHDESTWYPGSLYFRAAYKSPIAVSGGISGAITRDELLRRTDWTKVGPLPGRLKRSVSK